MLNVILMSLLIAGAATGACAQAPEASRRAPAASTEKIELIERYFEAVGLVAVTDGVIDAMLDRASISAYSRAEQETLRGAMRDSLQQTRPWLLERFARIYAEAFTLEEIEALVAFYEGPVGRSLTAKTIGLAAQTADILPQYQALVRRRFEQNLCPGRSCPAPGPVIQPDPIPMDRAD